MSGDWLERLALAAEQPVTRRAVLRLAGASLLAAAPLGALLRTPTAAGATARTEGDCLGCVFSQNNRMAAGRKNCAAAIVGSILGAPASGLAGGAGLAFGIGCLAGSFFPPAEDFCHLECQKPPRQPRPSNPAGNGVVPPWVFPPLKKAPKPAKKGSGKRNKAATKSRRKPGGGGGPCDTCPPGSACCPGSTDTGFICCALGCDKGGGCCGHVDGCGG